MKFATSAARALPNWDRTEHLSLTSSPVGLWIALLICVVLNAPNLSNATRPKAGLVMMIEAKRASRSISTRYSLSRRRAGATYLPRAGARTARAYTLQSTKQRWTKRSLKKGQKARTVFQSSCVALLLLACSGLTALSQAKRIRNVVLVHGAWADGSELKGVYDTLVKDGYNVSIVQRAGNDV